jgi:hypothetical protein
MAARSMIWGGAGLGLLVGLVLAFSGGGHWHTVLYAVLVGMGTGVAAEVVGWLTEEFQRLL